MSKFTGSLQIEEIKPGILWKLMSPIEFYIDSLNSGKKIVVPIGFITDGTTIPFILKYVIAVWGTYGRAAVIHDYLYNILKTNYINHPYVKTRKEADRIFLQAMEVCGTGFFLRYALYISVRLFGWYSIKCTPPRNLIL